MERVNERLRLARDSIEMLKERLRADRGDEVAREALLFRFTISIEAVWKAAQAVLAKHEGVEVGSPKGCVRASLDSGMFGAEHAEGALSAIDDRDLVTQAYTEDLAAELGARIPGHALVLHAWLAGLARRAGAH